VAKELGETSLMFMVHPTLSEENIRDTARAIQKVMLEAAPSKTFAAAAASLNTSRPGPGGV
jgi:hypothetical protein